MEPQDSPRAGQRNPGQRRLQLAQRRQNADEPGGCVRHHAGGADRRGNARQVGGGHLGDHVARQSVLVTFAGQRSAGLLDQLSERIPVVPAPASGEQELAGGEFGQVGRAQFPPDGCEVRAALDLQVAADLQAPAERVREQARPLDLVGHVLEDAVAPAVNVHEAVEGDIPAGMAGVLPRAGG